MRLFNFSLRLAAFSGFLTSAAVGCVITVGDGGKAADGEECPDSNSFLNDGKCFCSVGYDWCNEDNLSDLSCCENPTSNSDSNSNTNSNSNSNSGTTTNDVPTSGTTSDIPTTSDGTTGDGTTGDPLECLVDVEPPASCNAEVENFLCLQATDPVCDAEGSQFYVCTNGVWVEAPTGPDENCKADGFDFGVGCTDNGTAVEFVCGYGPGTPCDSGAPASCNGDITYEVCFEGKLTATDCEAFCMEEGEMGVTYDYGYCGEQRSEITCICCDEGVDGCPLGGESTGGGTTGEGTTGEGTTTGEDTTTG